MAAYSTSTTRSHPMQQSIRKSHVTNAPRGYPRITLGQVGRGKVKPAAGVTALPNLLHQSFSVSLGSLFPKELRRLL